MAQKFSASSFAVSAGVGLTISGVLLARFNRVGAWIFMGVFGATLFWSLAEPDFDGLPVAYRLVGPLILLVIIAVLMPSLRSWSRRRTVRVYSILRIATIAVGMLSGSDHESSDPARVADASPIAVRDEILQ